MDDTPSQGSILGCIGQLFCFGLGGLFLAAALIWMASAWLSAPNWVTVEGQIVQAQVSPETRNETYHAGRRRGYRTQAVTRYFPDVTYRYRVGGRDYTGFGIYDGRTPRYGNVEETRAALAPYRRATITVYYDPRDPERSCLDTSLINVVQLIIGGIGVLLLCIGFWLRALRREDAEGEDTQESG